MTQLVVSSPFGLPDFTIPAPNNDPAPSKAGEIAYEIFGLVPVIGTFIGIHHAYKACTSNDIVNALEIAKIITQIFSFLIIPQVIFGTACAIKALVDCCNSLPAPILPDSTEDNTLPPAPVGPDGLPLPLSATDANGFPLPMNFIAT